MRQIHKLGLIGAAAVLAGTSAQASIIFDDFNLTEGHFGYAPGFSGTSVGESTVAPLSTADRVESDGPFEGLGHQKLVLVHDGSATNMRIRHLTGSSPFGSAQAGATASNTPFVTSAGTDGFIGFYFKTSSNNPGWTIALNLDGADGAAASMDMGNARPVIADGQWHLYEWNLDDDNDWAAVTGIGGDGTIQNEQHTIDSIYIFTNTAGTAGQVRDPAYLDFVAKSDSGTVAALVPEPGALSLIGLGALGLIGRRSRRA
jgi:hypothetical protein